MNSTISLSQIITRLSKATGADTNTCRLFVREFFASATSALAADSTVEIKGVGTFRRSTQADENGNFAVQFIPDAAVADEANRAFSMFKAVEIPAGLELPDETEVAEEATISEPEQMPAPTPEPAPAPAPMPEHVEVREPETAQAPAMRHEPDPEPIVLPEPEAQSDQAPEPSFPEDETAETALPLPPKQRNRAWIWVIVIALLAGAALGIAAGLLADVTPPPVELPADEYPATLEDEEIQLPQAEMETENPEPSTMAPSQPETAQQPAPAPQPATTQEAVYETVSASNYLSSMARRHYGAQVYWVYIYEANADHLGHPDRIAPGTRLLIPPRSTFPQAASEREAREIAQRKANEIRARYSR